MPCYAGYTPPGLDQNSSDNRELLAPSHFEIGNRTDHRLLAIQNAHSESIAEVEHLRLLVS
jgi:hypothetical protein